MGTQAISAWSGYLWPLHRHSHPDIISFGRRCRWNECHDSSIGRWLCGKKHHFFVLCCFSPVLSVSSRQTSWLIPTLAGHRVHSSVAQSPRLTHIIASPQSALALQANNLLFANYKSITNTEVSVTPSPAHLSITNSDGACCIDLSLDYFQFPTEEIKPET